MDDLPDLGDFFKDEGIKKELEKNSDLQIQISKEEGVWITVRFIDIAVGGIGLHVVMPLKIELTASELSRMKIRFVKNISGNIEVVRELPVLVRWQETDTLTGDLKVGLHFGKEYDDDKNLAELLKTMVNQKKNKQI